MFRYLLSFTVITALLAAALLYAHLPGRQSELSTAMKEAESLRGQRLVLLKPYIEKALARSGKARDVRNLSAVFGAAVAGSHDSSSEAALDAALAKLVSNPEIYPLLLSDKQFQVLHNSLDENESKLSSALARVNLAANSRQLHNRGMMHRIANLVIPTMQQTQMASTPRENAVIISGTEMKPSGLYSVAME